MNRLGPVASALLEWAIDDALPFWATAGFDAGHDRFEERLALDGSRLPAVPIRLMSQARQIHAYSIAAQNGWHDGARGLVERAFPAMVRDYHRPDGADGWVFSIHRDGSVADPRRDLYSHGFVLLAVAAYIRATGRMDALALADETLAFLKRDMAAPLGGGFVEQLPPISGPRRQNPHMHLLEGLLSLWDSARQPRHLAMASEMVDLFASRFFRVEAGTLGEYFTDDLRPASGEAGAIVEPGHHYEWVWLLRRFERAAGRPMQHHVDALLAHADRYGFDASGMIVGEVLLDGVPRPGGRRIWPITEAIRSNLVELPRDRPHAEERAAQLGRLLQERFLTRRPRGGWHDELEPDGRCRSLFMPASTLYHLMGAIEELSRHADRRAAAAD